MSQRQQENVDERVEPAPNQEHDDHYGMLVWPSLSNGHIASDSNSSPLYGPVSLSSESEGGHSWGSRSGSRPPSPLVFAPIVNWGSPPPVADDFDFGAVPPDEPEAGGQVPEQKALPRSSSLFNLRFFFSQMSQHLARAIDGVKIKLRKPKSQAQ